MDTIRDLLVRRVMPFGGWMGGALITREAEAFVEQQGFLIAPRPGVTLWYNEDDSVSVADSGVRLMFTGGMILALEDQQPDADEDELPEG